MCPLHIEASDTDLLGDVSQLAASMRKPDRFSDSSGVTDVLGILPCCSVWDGLEYRRTKNKSAAIPFCSLRIHIRT